MNHTLRLLLTSTALALIVVPAMAQGSRAQVRGSHALGNTGWRMP